CAQSCRDPPSINQASGRAARLALDRAETIAAAARHRATVRDEEAIARLIDIQTAVEVHGGKIEFESGEEGREEQILQYLLRTATAQVARTDFGDLDFNLRVEAFGGMHTITTSETV